MNDILSKISSYNIFNNLIPGAVLVYILFAFDIYLVDTKSIITDLILFYFIGMIVSRFGSIVIEPIFKKVRFVRYAEYDDYMAASAKDDKIAILLEENNQYRTFVSLITIVILCFSAKEIVEVLEISAFWIGAVSLLCLLVLFALSYRKQTNYIRKRVEKSK